MDPIATCREVSPGLRREFTLHASKVVVIGRVISGSEFETHVPLGELNSDIGTRRFRSARCYYGLALFALLAAFLWIFIVPFGQPLNATRVIVTAVLALGSFAWGIAYLGRFTAYTFLNKAGVLVLDVIESGPDRANCREFAHRIRDCVNALQEVDRSSGSE